MNPTLGVFEQPLWRIWRALQDEEVDLFSGKGILDPHLLPFLGMAFDPKNSVMPDEKLKRFNKTVGTDMSGFGAELGVAIATDPLSWLTSGLSSLGKGGKAAGAAVAGRKAPMAVMGVKAAAKALQDEQVQQGLYRVISNAAGDSAGAAAHGGYTKKAFSDLMPNAKVNDVRAQLDAAIAQEGKLVGQAGEEIGESLTDAQLQGLRDFRKNVLGDFAEADEVLIKNDSMLDFINRGGSREMGIGAPILGDLFGMYKPVSHAFQAKQGNWMNWYFNTIKKSYKVMGYVPAKLAGGVLGMMDNVAGIGTLTKESRRVVTQFVHHYKNANVPTVVTDKLGKNPDQSHYGGTLAGIDQRAKYLEGVGPKIMNSLDIKIKDVDVNVVGSELGARAHIETFLKGLESAEGGLVKNFKATFKKGEFEEALALLGLSKTILTNSDPAVVRAAIQDSLQELVEKSSIANGSFGTAAFRGGSPVMEDALKEGDKLTRENWPGWLGRATSNLRTRAFVSDFGTVEAKAFSDATRIQSSAQGHFLNQAIIDINQSIKQITDHNMLGLAHEEVSQIFMAKMGLKTFSDELSIWTAGGIDPNKPLFHTLGEFDEFISSRVNGELEAIIGIVSSKLGVEGTEGLGGLQTLLNNISQRRATLPIKDIEDLLQVYPQLKPLLGATDEQGNISIGQLRGHLNNLDGAINEDVRKAVLRRFNVEEHQLYHVANDSTVRLQAPITWATKEEVLKDIVSGNKNLVAYTPSTKHPELLTLTTTTELGAANSPLRNFKTEQLFGKDGVSGIHGALLKQKAILKSAKASGGVIKTKSPKELRAIAGIEETDSLLVQQAKIKEAQSYVDADLDALQRYRGILDEDAASGVQRVKLSGVTEPTVVKDILRIGTKNVGDSKVPLTAADELGVLDVTLPGSRDIVSNFMTLHTRLMANMEKIRVWGDLHGAGTPHIKTQGVAIPQVMLGEIADDMIDLGNISDQLLQGMFDSGLVREGNEMLPGEFAIALINRLKEHSVQIGLNNKIIGTSGSVPFGYLHRIPDGAEQRIIKEAIDWMVDSPSSVSSHIVSILETRADRGLTIGEINYVDNAIALQLEGNAQLGGLNRLFGDWRESLTGSRKVAKYSEDPAAALISHLKEIGDVLRTSNIYELAGTEAGRKIGLETFTVMGVSKNEFRTASARYSPDTRARITDTEVQTEIERSIGSVVTNNQIEQTFLATGPSDEMLKMLEPLDTMAVSIDKAVEALLKTGGTKKLATFSGAISVDALVSQIAKIQADKALPLAIKNDLQVLKADLKFVQSVGGMGAKPELIQKLTEDVAKNYRVIKDKFKPLTPKQREARLKELKAEQDNLLDSVSGNSYIGDEFPRPSKERYIDVDGAGEVPHGSYHFQDNLNALKEMELTGPNQAAFQDLVPKNWWAISGLNNATGGREAYKLLQEAYTAGHMNELTVAHAIHLFEFNPALLKELEYSPNLFLNHANIARNNQIDDIIAEHAIRMKSPLQRRVKTTLKDERSGLDKVGQEFVDDADVSTHLDDLEWLAGDEAGRAALREIQDLQYRNLLSVVGKAALVGTEQEKVMADTFLMLKETFEAEGGSMVDFIQKGWGLGLDEATEFAHDVHKFSNFVMEAVLDAKGLDDLERVGFGAFITKVKERIRHVLNFLVNKFRGEPQSINTHQAVVEELNAMARGMMDLEGDSQLSWSLADHAIKRLNNHNNYLLKRIHNRLVDQSEFGLNPIGGKLTSYGDGANLQHNIRAVNGLYEQVSGQANVVEDLVQVAESSVNRKLIEEYRTWATQRGIAAGEGPGAVIEAPTREALKDINLKVELEGIAIDKMGISEELVKDMSREELIDAIVSSGGKRRTRDGRRMPIEESIQEIKTAAVDTPYGHGGEAQSFNVLVDPGSFVDHLDVYLKRIMEGDPEALGQMNQNLIQQNRLIANEARLYAEGSVQNQSRVAMMLDEDMKAASGLTESMLDDANTLQGEGAGFVLRTGDDTLLGQLEMHFSPEELKKFFGLKTRDAYEKEFMEVFGTVEVKGKEILGPKKGGEVVEEGRRPGTLEGVNLELENHIDSAVRKGEFTPAWFKKFQALQEQRSDILLKFQEKAVEAQGRLELAQNAASFMLLRTKLVADLRNLSEMHSMVSKTAVVLADKKSGSALHLARRDVLEKRNLGTHSLMNLQREIPEEAMLSLDGINTLSQKIGDGVALTKAETTWVEEVFKQDLDLVPLSAQDVPQFALGTEEIAHAAAKRVAKMEAVGQGLQTKMDELKVLADNIDIKLTPGLSAKEARAKVREALNTLKKHKEPQPIGFASTPEELAKFSPDKLGRLDRQLNLALKASAEGDNRLLKAFLNETGETLETLNLAKPSKELIKRHGDNPQVMQEILAALTTKSARDLYVAGPNGMQMNTIQEVMNVAHEAVENLTTTHPRIMRDLLAAADGFGPKLNLPARRTAKDAPIDPKLRQDLTDSKKVESEVKELEERLEKLNRDQVEADELHAKMLDEADNSTSTRTFVEGKKGKTAKQKEAAWEAGEKTRKGGFDKSKPKKGAKQGQTAAQQLAAWNKEAARLKKLMGKKYKARPVPKFKDRTGPAKYKPKPKPKGGFKDEVDTRADYYESRVVAQEELDVVNKHLRTPLRYTKEELAVFTARQKHLQKNLKFIADRIRKSGNAAKHILKTKDGLKTKALFNKVVARRDKGIEKLLEQDTAARHRENLLNDGLLSRGTAQVMNRSRDGLVRNQSSMVTKDANAPGIPTPFGNVDKFQSKQRLRHMEGAEKLDGGSEGSAMANNLMDEVTTPTATERVAASRTTPDAALHPTTPGMKTETQTNAVESNASYNLVVRETDGSIRERPLSFLANKANGHAMASYGKGETIQEAVSQSTRSGAGAERFLSPGQVTPEFVNQHLIGHQVMVGPANLTKAMQEGVRLDAPSSINSFWKFYDSILAVTKMLATTLKLPLDFATNNVLSGIPQSALGEIGIGNYLSGSVLAARIISRDVSTAGLDELNSLVHYGGSNPVNRRLRPAKMVTGAGSDDIMSMGRRGASDLAPEFKGVDATTEELWVTNKTGNSFYIPEVIAEGIELGAFDTFTHAEVRNMINGDSVRELRGRFMGDPSAMRKTKDGLLRFAENSETFVRLSMMLGSIVAGFTPAQAAQKTAYAMLDYGDKTRMERNFFNRTAFFWTYPKKMIPRAGKWLLSNPSKGASTLNQFFTTMQGEHEGQDMQLISSEGRPELMIGDYRINPARLNPMLDSVVALGAVADILVPGLSSSHREMSGEAAFDKPISPNQIANVAGWEEFFPTEDPLNVRGDWLDEATNSNWAIKLLTGQGSPFSSRDPQVEYSALETMAKSVLPYRKVRPGQEAGRKIKRIRYYMRQYQNQWKEAQINGDQLASQILERKLEQMQRNILGIRRDNPGVDSYG
tara:strand:- start:2144 stop:12379 length:10236 start_codon:yes stop_codon:yes gene_type:complete